MSGVVVRTCAKVNLSLRVLGRRPDGYHEVQTVMQAIGLWDCVRLRPRDDDLISVEVVGGEAPADESNSCWRAARVMAEEVGRSDPGRAVGVSIELQKSVPVGAGLGGGSSDAAATLAGLTRLREVDFRGGPTGPPRLLSDRRLDELAARIGADVPFFLRGGCCLARGKGEKLRSLPAVSIWLVLVAPGEPVPTAEAYASLGRGAAAGSRPRLSRPVQRMVAAVSEGGVEAVAAELHNDFEAADLPGVAAARRAKVALLSAGCVGAGISGSGSAAFGIARDLAEAQALAEELRREWEWVQVVRTLQPQESMVLSDLREPHPRNDVSSEAPT